MKLKNKIEAGKQHRLQSHQSSRFDHLLSPAPCWWSELSDAKLGRRVCQALKFSFAEIILRKDLFQLKVFNVRDESKLPEF